MIDSHCHLDFEPFDHDREQVIQRAVSLGVKTILLPGTAANRWQNQIALCHQYPQLRFALGLHPYFLDIFRHEHLEHLDELLSTHKNEVLAVGEIGLDFAITNIDTAQGERQREVFENQLSLAEQHSLPVIIHHRKSHNELIRVLKHHSFRCGGVIHAFSGSYQEAKRYLDMGFKLGVGGTITYPRARKTIDTIRQLPLEAIVLETDAPDMPVSGYQGQRNSPEYLVQILDALTAIRTESREEIEAVTDLNFAALFDQRDRLGDAAVRLVD